MLNGRPFGPINIGGFKGLFWGGRLGKTTSFSIFRTLNPGGPRNCVRIMSLIHENGWVVLVLVLGHGTGLV